MGIWLLNIEPRVGVIAFSDRHVILDLAIAVIENVDMLVDGAYDPFFAFISHVRCNC